MRPILDDATDEPGAATAGRRAGAGGDEVSLDVV
jgi:hypothetical protein